ncbi:MAG TPA: Uma2 family endonuclease [Burkholderiales bacterium]|nr:Uma2 family endonuclease [Burkholderiales bacterium]
MHVEAVLEPAALVRRWHELSRNPDTPDHYELNEYGEMIMAPRPTNDHQRVLSAVVVALNAQLGPESAAEVSVLTDRGIRVPDVVWMPESRWAQLKGKTPLPLVPDVCVEVLSPGNTQESIAMKTAAYLRGGAREVIVIGLGGEVDFFDTEGKRATSALGIRLDLPATLF